MQVSRYINWLLGLGTRAKLVLVLGAFIALSAASGAATTSLERETTISTSRHATYEYDSTKFTDYDVIKSGGEDGVSKQTYIVTKFAGLEVGSKLIKEEVIKAPVNDVRIKGTLSRHERSGVTVEIPFEVKQTPLNTLAKGKIQTKTPGVIGLKSVTYIDVYDGTKPISSTVKSEVILKQPVTQEDYIGTAICDPNYSGPCVPIASDVDCSSGNGDGPAYVRGPVYVIGIDIYDLDGNGDGVGCERG